MVRPGLRESDIAARVTDIALAAGGGLSFPVIATIHGETLHNHYHGNTLAPGDLFLLDCGAETAMHYAGDLSSTFPVDTAFDEPPEGRLPGGARRPPGGRRGREARSSRSARSTCWPAARSRRGSRGSA